MEETLHSAGVHVPITKSVRYRWFGLVDDYEACTDSERYATQEQALQGLENYIDENGHDMDNFDFLIVQEVGEVKQQKKLVIEALN